MKDKFICEICGKELPKVGKGVHMITHQDPSQVPPCKYCGRTYRNILSLRNHERGCSVGPNPMRLCDISGPVWNKGKTKETDERVAQMAEACKKYFETHPGTFKGKHHTEATKQHLSKRISKIEKEAFATGKQVPAEGIGRGKYSYLIYHGTRYMFRSTYEFIFGLVLSMLDIDFHVENILVPASSDNVYSASFRCDFNVQNTIIEVKGISSNKDKYIRESFEAKGYKFYILYEPEITQCSSYLKSCGFDLDTLLHEIKLGHDSKVYKVYDFNDLSKGKIQSSTRILDNIGITIE